MPAYGCGPPSGRFDSKERILDSASSELAAKSDEAAAALDPAIDVQLSDALAGMLHQDKGVWRQTTLQEDRIGLTVAAIGAMSSCMILHVHLTYTLLLPVVGVFLGRQLGLTRY